MARLTKAERNAITKGRSAAQIHQEIVAYGELMRELFARKKALTAKHPDQYVALYREGDGYGYFTAATFTELLDESDARGLDRGGIATAFLHRKEPTYIL